jgi:plasmid stability protein
VLSSGEEMTTLTLDLPDPIYTLLKNRAEHSQRSVEAEVLDLVASAVPATNQLPDDLAEAISSLALLDDPALWNAARSRLSQDALAHLESLHLKRQREGLTEVETQTLTGLMRQYELALLVRAEAAALLGQRGHDISELLASA